MSSMRICNVCEHLKEITKDRDFCSLSGNYLTYLRYHKGVKYIFTPTDCHLLAKPTTTGEDKQ